MRSATVLILAALLPATGPAGEKGTSRLSGGRDHESATERIERPAARKRAPEAVFEPYFRGLFLTPLPPVVSASGGNPIEAQLGGTVFPRALEAVASHLALREAGRHWRRFAGKSLRDRYSADPSYSAHDLARDQEKMRKGWGRRKIDSTHRLSLGLPEARRGRTAPTPNLLENRFLTIDQDLRLRFHLQEMVGIVIGDGPEDDYSFRPLEARAAASPRARKGPRPPRVQIRGRARLHIDRDIADGQAPWSRLFDRYGGRISVDLLSRETPEKIVSGVVEVTRDDGNGMHLVVGLTRRF